MGAHDRAQYAALHALWVAGASVVFNPEITAGTTYNVYIENLTGEYWQRQDDTDAFRKMSASSSCS